VYNANDATLKPIIHDNKSCSVDGASQYEDQFDSLEKVLFRDKTILFKIKNTCLTLLGTMVMTALTDMTRDLPCSMSASDKKSAGDQLSKTVHALVNHGSLHDAEQLKVKLEQLAKKERECEFYTGENAEKKVCVATDHCTLTKCCTNVEKSLISNARLTSATRSGTFTTQGCAMKQWKHFKRRNNA
jgi:hypothetical protein